MGGHERLPSVGTVQGPRLTHTAMKTLRFATGALAALATITACSGTSSPEDRLVVGEASIEMPGGLSQRVTLVPAEPASGQNVEVRSVVVNNGTAAAQLTARTCGLDYEGSLELTQPPEVMKCAGHSMTASLAPGDSLVGADLMRVSSAPGDYELRVRQLLDPSHWVSLQVVVRAP